jgi:PAS domain S-box-containing protein
MKKNKSPRRLVGDSTTRMKKNVNGSASKARVANTSYASNGNGAHNSNSQAPHASGPDLAREQAIQRYIELYDFAPTGYVSFDRSGRIAEINLTAAALFGMRRESLMGMPLAVLVWREDMPVFLHHLLRCRSQENRVQTELRLKRRNGEIIYAELSSMPTTASQQDGAVLFQTAIIDLTERKEAEVAIQEKEAELELIVTQTPFMLTRCTRDLRYHYVSRAYAELMGTKQEEIAGKRIVDVLGKRGFEKIRPYVDRVLSGETVSYEALVPSKSGQHFLNATYVPDKNERGEVTGWFASILDVSERKRAEERFRMAVEASPSGMIMVDQNRKMVLVNSQAEKLFGYTREELLGKSVEMLMPERFRRQLASVAEPRTLGIGRELFGLRKDGSEVPVEVGLNPLRMGGRRFVLSSIVDTTERKKAQEKIAANLKAVTLLHELGEFCARPSNSVHRCLQEILQTAITIANADKGNLQILNPHSGALQIVVESGFSKPFLKFFRKVQADDPSACSVAMREAKYTIVEDITRSSIFAGQPSLEVLIAAGVRAVHSVPLKSTAGNLVGILSVHYSQPHRPHQRELGFMDLLARQAADYLERKNAEEMLLEVAQQQSALYQLARRWQKAKSLDEMYDAALDAITSALDCERASILLYDDQQVMRFVAWRGLSTTYRKAVEGHSPWKPGTKNPKPMYIADTRLAEMDKPLKTAIRREGIRAAAFIPLTVEGKLTGKFMMYHRVPHVFTDAELNLAITIARQLAQAVQHAKDEEALRESEARMRATVEQATAGVGRCDANGRLVFVNRTLCQMLGYTESELLGKTIGDLTHPDDAQENVRLFKQLMRDGKPFELEKRYIRSDGSIIWGHVSVSPVRDTTGAIKSAVAVAVDVTAQKEAEVGLQKAKEQLEQRVRERTQALHKTNKQLQSEIERRKGLEGEILSVSDREQQRLGQELHDGLCQHLTAVAFMTRSIAMRLRDHRVVDAEDIEKIAELVNKAAVDTRNLSRALHRVDVDAAGLLVGLQDLVDREIWRTPCRLEAKPSFRLDDDVAAGHLYRIAREAVINANKHAQARQIVVKLERVRNEMVLRVIDDGVGVSKERKAHTGLGFHIMNYRAQVMGGRLEIDASETGGTRLSCYLPARPPPGSDQVAHGDRTREAIPNNTAIPVTGDRTLRHLARQGAANG